MSLFVCGAECFNKVPLSFSGAGRVSDPVHLAWAQVQYPSGMSPTYHPPYTTYGLLIFQDSVEVVLAEFGATLEEGELNQKSQPYNCSPQ